MFLNKYNYVLKNKISLSPFINNIPIFLKKYKLNIYFFIDFWNKYKFLSVNFYNVLINIFIRSFFNKFYIYLSFFKKNTIKYNSIYFNFFIKFNYVTSSFLYNFYNFNELLLFKQFNFLYKQNLNNSDKLHLKNNLFFFKMKKKNEFVKPSLITPYDNFFNLAGFSKKNHFKALKLRSTFFENINFSKKINSKLITYKNNFFFKDYSEKFKNFYIFSFNYKNVSTLSSKIVKNIFIKDKNKFIWVEIQDDLDLFLNDLFFKLNPIFFKNIKYYNYKLTFNHFYYKFKTFYHSFKIMVILFFKKFKKCYAVLKINLRDSNKNFLYNFSLNNHTTNVLKTLTFLNDFYHDNIYLNSNLIFKYYQNKIYKNNLHLPLLKILEDFDDSDLFTNKSDNNSVYYNNYYPVFYANTKTFSKFFSKFKFNININYLTYTHLYVLGFLENFFKKNFFLKITNNHFNKIKEIDFLYSIHDDYKNFQPKYMKNFLIVDFIEIVWYAFTLKDLNIISDWVCNFMEFTSFRVHKKFLTFFQNFINKYCKIFIEVLKIKGFFFDIRGKVGVTGNSKKRHFFFKFGKLNRSTKIKKMNFKQSVVRTPSGAMGLTFLINY